MDELSISDAQPPPEPTSARPAPSTSAAQAIDFLTLVQNLKTTKRTGWIRSGVAGPESIADHMYRMSLMALLAGDAGVDTNRCIRLAIVHDVAEAIVGDIAPSDGVSKEDKRRLEEDAIRRIHALLGQGSSAGREIEALFLEYEAGESAEARLVKDFDKVEMVLQAAEYEAAQGLRLQPFFSSTAGRFQTPTGRAWAAEVARRRAPPDAGAAAGAAGAPAARGPAPGAEEGRGCGGAGAAGSGSHPAAADGAPEGEGGPGHGAADAAALSAAAAAGAGARTRRSESGGAGGHAPTAGLAEAEDAPLGGAQRAEARRRREAGALAGGQARAQEPCRGGASAG